jgi:Zn-dependent protease with chaperone function
MLEHVTRAVYYTNIHLLFASAVGVCAWVLTSIPFGSATTKYWIWVATSLNFIFPTGAILDALEAPHLQWASPLGVVGDAASRLSRSPAAPVLLLAWLSGSALLLTRLLSRLREERREAGAPGGPRAPAVEGVLRPRISLPAGIGQVLNDRELDAVLIHERIHVRRRDNLIRLIHELGRCALWFHPLVWFAGARLAFYRELSCDESVIRRGRGAELIAALGKLAAPEGEFLLEAGVGSYLSHRVARLASARVRGSFAAANTFLAVTFSALLLAGVFETVAHTACCFVSPR